LYYIPDSIFGIDGFMWKLRDFGDAFDAREELLRMKSHVKEICFYNNPPQPEIYDQFKKFANSVGLPYGKINRITTPKPLKNTKDE
jgi:hypothetical protein